MEEHWTTIVANVVTSLGILGFIVLYLAHRQSEAQFRFTVMLSCIERFQNLSPLLKKSNDPLTLRRYVDLTNEEFFYFQRNYIPKDVIVEWLDTIVEYFPLYVPGRVQPINYDSLPWKQIHDEKILHGYPRLMKAFMLPDEAVASDKVELIKTVARNVGVTLKTKHFKDALLLDLPGDK